MGIGPDWMYDMTVEDIRNSYAPYRDALLSALERWIFADTQTKTPPRSRES